MPTITNQHGDKVTISDKIVLHSCPSCFVVHGIPEDMERRMLEDRGSRGKSCYCPNGHTWFFTGETELDRTKKALERERTIAADRLRRLESQRELTALERRRVAAAKGRITKMKNRIANGVCPCCNRHFENVERHMKSQHPDFKKPE